MRRLVLGAAIAASCLLVAEARAEPVRIGFIATMSGPGGALGRDLLDGFQLGIAQNGGTLGGAEIALTTDDDQLRPEVGLQVATRMIERDNVEIIVGIVFSNVMMAIAAPVTEAEVFLVSANAGPSPLAGAQCSPFFFSTSWQNDQTHEAVGRYLQDQGVQRLFVLAPNYQAGWDSIEGVKRHFRGEIVGEIYTQVNQPDYAAELAQVRAAAPEAVFVFYPGGMGVNWVKQYAQAGLKETVPLYTAFTVDETTLPAQGADAVGVHTASFWSPDLDVPANARFVEGFREAYGRDPSHFAAQAYDAAMLLGAALAKTGGSVADKDAFRAALKAAEFESVRGEFRFNNNHFPIQNFYVQEVVSRDDGTIGLELRGTAFESHLDAYHQDCPM
jgi:branched-chain amino acid transport system substrate-binding protein